MSHIKNIVCKLNKKQERKFTMSSGQFELGVGIRAARPDPQTFYPNRACPGETQPDRAEKV